MDRQTKLEALLKQQEINNTMYLNDYVLDEEIRILRKERNNEKLPVLRETQS